MKLDARHAVLLPCVISFALVLQTVPPATWWTTASLSLASGVSALSLMAAAALLGARWRWLEACFGGLDRVYQVHKWLGVWALVLASVHLSFKAGTQAWDSSAVVHMPGDLTRLVRQLSFLSLMLIVLLALNRKIPYSSWRWWHKLSGPLFLIVIAHWLSIKSPIVLQSPAGYWLAGMSVLGISGAAWKLLLYPWLSRHADYRVVGVTRSEAAVRIEMSPSGKPIRFLPGQFGFLSMQVDGLREPHPFTFAGAAGTDGRVVFMIRALGDYTRQLVAQVEVGMHAAVYAPFGRFERRGQSAREIWIAGGVGISPFLAWLDDPQAPMFDRVSLFYFHSPGRSFPEPAELEVIARTRGVELICIDSGPGNPDFGHRLKQIIAESGVAGLDVAFCGPPGLLESVRSPLRACGVAPTQIRLELFEFR
jgi:predicted ferric reductase